MTWQDMDALMKQGFDAAGAGLFFQLQTLAKEQELESDVSLPLSAT
jgi:hypothetical protein